jgi:REP element-mobilizing transposase RayT
MRETPFIEGECYHVYNRGVEKRDVFLDENDVNRFIQSINLFNSTQPIGSIYENSFKKAQLGRPTSKLVDFVAFCLNPNHFHLLIIQRKTNGISEFMKRLSGGYTKYFNEKHSRDGALFQGRFKSKHVNSNEYLLHLSAYINLNSKIHSLGRPTSKLCRSSWDEYVGDCKNGLCSKNIVIEQFENIKDYEDFAHKSMEDIKKRRASLKDLEFEKDEPLGRPTSKWGEGEKL